MPVKALSSRLEKQDRDAPLIRYSDFSGGVGARFYNEESSDLQETLGYFFGYIDTWIPGQWTLPMITTPQTLTGESGTTDYGCVAAGFLNGRQRVIVAKGTKIRMTTDVGDLPAGTTVAGAQGRQILIAPIHNDLQSGTNVAVWFTGPHAASQISVDGTNWTAIGGAADDTYVDNDRTVFGFLLQAHSGESDPSQTFIYGVGVRDRKASVLDLDDVKWPSATSTGPIFEPKGTRPFLYLGNLQEYREAYFTNGDEIQKLERDSAGLLTRTILNPPSISDITAGCIYRDEFALSDGDTIMLWGEGRPPRHWPIWRKDGCPVAMAGKVVALASVADYLLAVWQLNSTGGCIVFWSRYNQAGQLTWHPRTKKLTGDLLFGHGPNIAILDPSDGNSPAAEYSDGFANTGYPSSSDWTQMAQGFQVETTATIKAVELYLKRADVNQDADLYVDIQTDSAGVASGTPVTNGTSDAVSGSKLGTTGGYGWFSFPFSTAPSLTAATQYHVVLRTAAGLGISYLWEGHDAGIYALGQASYLDPPAGFVALAAVDMAFRVIPVTQPTHAGTRYLWLATASGSHGYAHWQPHPHPGWNPITDSTMGYENGFLYLYTGWEPLQLMGDEAGALTEVERDAEFWETASQITVDYRFDYDGYLSEEDANAGWKTDLAFKSTRRLVEIGAGAGRQGNVVQFRIGLDRTNASGSYTPVGRHLGTTVKRQARHPAQRRS